MYSPGDQIYLSDSVAGGWTTSPPVFPSYVISLGVVSKVDAADGEIEVRIDSHAFEELQVDGPADFEIGLTSHGNIDVTNNLVVNLASPILATDAANKGYVDSAVSSGTGALTTDDIPEGSLNEYYLDSRARSAISVTGSGTYNPSTGVIDIQGGVTSVNLLTGDIVLTTSEINEGTNLYYTDARFDTRLSLKSTTDLSEGANLYYTTARANTAIDARVTKTFVDALGIQAASVDPDSVALGTDTTGNYVATIAGNGGGV